MSKNSDYSEGSFNKFLMERRSFIRKINLLSTEVAEYAEVYLLEIVDYQADKSLKYAAISRLKEILEKYVETESGDMERFDQLFNELISVMSDIYEEFIGPNPRFVPAFRFLLVNRLSSPICLTLLIYQIDLDFAHLFNTTRDLETYCARSFRHTFYSFLLDSVQRINLALIKRNQLEMEIFRAKSARKKGF